MTYKVFSKWKTGKDYQVERSFEIKSYAIELSENLKKQGKMTKIKRF